MYRAVSARCVAVRLRGIAVSLSGGFLIQVEGPVGTRFLLLITHEQPGFYTRQFRFGAHPASFFELFLAENAHAGLGDIDAVNQRFSCQVGVNQCRDDPQFVEGNQCGEKLDAVFHHQADRVTSFQSQRIERAGIAIRLGVQLVPGQGLILKSHRGVLGEAGCGGAPPWLRNSRW